MNTYKEKLFLGYRNFISGKAKLQRDLYQDLIINGQKPKIMVICCSDSRVNPSDIFNVNPGDIFEHQNVANIVPSVDSLGSSYGTLAAVEYAVMAVKVEVIIVIGHEACGGIKGCLDGMGYNASGYVGKWVSVFNEVREKLIQQHIPKEKLQIEMELEGVRQSLRNLMTYKFVEEAVNSGQLELLGSHFSVSNRELSIMNSNGEFKSLK
jgi:carbonic anhydrase